MMFLSNLHEGSKQQPEQQQKKEKNNKKTPPSERDCTSERLYCAGSLACEQITPISLIFFMKKNKAERTT